ncbi:MAG TPA: excinuclease ABC subunit UvrC [Sneathiellales bacterium]|nr:excinuclease ABC subunit UvrC [Sneathiellales bacterium]
MSKKTTSTSVAARGDGRDVIRAAARNLPSRPGVYRMIDSRGTVLYVGKAKNLKKRVNSYLNMTSHSNRIARMVLTTADLEIITTHTEVEALLLEANLIKQLKPVCNVLLRDDKSFPYIHLTHGKWARLTKHRGARSKDGDFFGPFASAGAVNHTLNTLQRAFMLRSCSDSVFRSRSRPCLLHQIKRCTAPCVEGHISHSDYNALVEESRQFLSGRSQKIQRRLSDSMQTASAEMEFEKAAVYRDRIKALTQIQAHQEVNFSGLNEADVIAAHRDGGQTCIQVFFFRSGQNWGNRAYYPRHDAQQEMGEVLAAFIGQFYDNKPPPRLVLLSDRPHEQALIEEALSLKADRKVKLLVPQRGDKRAVVDHALTNAREALERRLSESASQLRLLEDLADAFDLDAPPQRIEVYDNSHISGTNATGAMIVAGPEGLMKNAYRKFNIKDKNLTPGDDYGMMREVLTRRFSRLLKEDQDRTNNMWPDLVLIDGGAGQLSAVLEVFADLGVDDVAIAAIAKGPDRNAGRERFFLPGKAPVSLEPRSPVFYFLQRLRDESHRFAIGTHRAKRAKSTRRSRLDDIPGVGARRKRALLHHFGAASSVERAGLADLEAVEGISKVVAKTIYDHFHEGT